MVQFARQFPDHAEVAELVTRVSWSHVYTLLAIKSDDARDFYAAEAAVKRLSVRELKKAISRKAYERRKIANSQIPEGSAVPRDTFRDPLRRPRPRIAASRPFLATHSGRFCGTRPRLPLGQLWVFR
ncbi:DUF1016 N-terminal domain-containing protein [Nocardioides jensenii]|uniref:DUF1016 N-terminal domain-containing protein n=1 Tax=Nocardioides jensenii TaxID=1843 RepID=UPI001FE1694F|nr:DUF1016 N-terminal domain-containing protein [Nocardioides jensenii]